MNYANQIRSGTLKRYRITFMPHYIKKIMLSIYNCNQRSVCIEFAEKNEQKVVSFLKQHGFNVGRILPAVCRTKDLILSTIVRW